MLVWCDTEDCLFHEKTSCTECRECAYCGKYLYWSGNRHNIHFDHILPYSSAGRTVVPVCGDCNLSKGRKGLKEWLRWLSDNRPDKLEDIVGDNSARDYIEYMMGHTISAYNDVKMKGIEFPRNLYASSGLSIRPKTKISKIEQLKLIIEA